MGCAASSAERNAAFISNMIDEELEIQRENDKKEVKILLLGAGESGKSTIVKQMRIIHGNGYNLDECEQYKPVIYVNALESMFAILNAMKNLEVEFFGPSRLNDVEKLFEMTSKSTKAEITFETGAVMDRLWNDEGLQDCYARSREYQLNDSAGYYLSSIQRISDPKYIPTRKNNCLITNIFFSLG